jgi:hypothetical protein
MAKGESELMERCQKLNHDDIAGLFYMVLGGMTQLEVWPIFRDIVEQMLPTWEGAENENSYQPTG